MGVKKWYSSPNRKGTLAAPSTDNKDLPVSFLNASPSKEQMRLSNANRKKSMQSRLSKSRGSIEISAQKSRQPWKESKNRELIMEIIRRNEQWRVHSKQEKLEKKMAEAEAKKEQIKNQKINKL